MGACLAHGGAAGEGSGLASARSVRGARGGRVAGSSAAGAAALRWRGQRGARGARAEHARAGVVPADGRHGPRAAGIPQGWRGVPSAWRRVTAARYGAHGVAAYAKDLAPLKARTRFEKLSAF